MAASSASGRGAFCAAGLGRQCERLAALRAERQCEWLGHKPSRSTAARPVAEACVPPESRASGAQKTLRAGRTQKHQGPPPVAGAVCTAGQPRSSHVAVGSSTAAGTGRREPLLARHEWAGRPVARAAWRASGQRSGSVAVAVRRASPWLSAVAGRRRGERRPPSGPWERLPLAAAAGAGARGAARRRVLRAQDLLHHLHTAGRPPPPPAGRARVRGRGRGGSGRGRREGGESEDLCLAVGKGGGVERSLLS